jgi:deferrochelatase/peroxidase EfeB
MTQEYPSVLELNDIQSGVLRPRQLPYVAQYLIVRIDDPGDGRELLKRLTPSVGSAAEAASPAADAWVMLALSYNGLKALGVGQSGHLHRSTRRKGSNRWDQ